MSPDERSKVGEYWLGLAQMYGKEINRTAMKIMLDAIDDIPADKTINALNSWAKTSKLGRHPLPADIRDIAFPPIDDRSVAIVMARKIDKAVRTHGRYWNQGIMGYEGMYFESCGKQFKTWKEAVLEELGPIGWATISQKGGWDQTTNSANEMEEQNFIAQTRDQIQANMQLERQGVDLAKLEMPKPKNEIGLLPSSKSIFKLIQSHDDDRELTSHEENELIDSGSFAK